MARAVKITCNGNTVADSRFYNWGITEGTLKLGIDDTIPQLEITISEQQSGYGNIELGGDVMVYFDDVLKFRGRLDEIDIDSEGYKTVIANGDISRLKDVYKSTWNKEQYYALNTGIMPDEIVSCFNEWNPSSSIKLVSAMDSTIAKTDTVFCPSSGSTMLDALEDIRNAFVDKSVHYYIKPSTGTNRNLYLVSGVKYSAVYVDPYFKKTYVMDKNAQAIQFGVNMTSISVEQTRRSTVFYHDAKDLNGDDVSFALLGSGPRIIFQWNGEYKNAVSEYCGKVEKPDTDDYGFIYELVNIGTVPYTDLVDAMTAAYEILIKRKGIEAEGRTITVEGVDMHYVDGSEEIDPYKLVRVISTKHGIDDWYTINSITYNLLDPTDTKISVGTEQSLITKG